MSKFRLITKYGDSLPILLRIQQEGNTCDFWMKDEHGYGVYDGILKRINSLGAGLTKDTNIIVDMTGMGDLADSLRDKGLKVYGGGKLQDKMEDDREYACALAEQAGMNVPSHQSFNSFNEAKSFVEKNNKIYVFKPKGEHHGFTYADADSPEDLIEFLDYMEKHWKGKVEFVLQEHIEGIEISLELWFVNGEPIMDTLNSTFETKRLSAGDLGQQTGCQSSVVRFWQDKNPKIYQESLKKMLPALKLLKYNSALDVNQIVSEKDKKPYFLEFTPRFGWSALFAFCAGLNMPLGKFFADLCSGKIPDVKPSYDWLGAVRVTVPPYPDEPFSFGKEEEKKLIGQISQENYDKVVKVIDEKNKEWSDRPIRGIKDLENIWLLDAKLEKDKLLTSGKYMGIVCEVTGSGKTLKELEKDIYKRIGTLKIPEMDYRLDAIEILSDEMPKLEGWGYIENSFPMPHKDVYVRLEPSKIQGVGVFAIRDIPKGTDVFKDEKESDGVLVDKAKIQNIDPELKRLYDDFCFLDGNKYDCPEDFNSMTVSWFLNESKVPNVRYIKDGTGFITVRDIKKGEELTVDYSTENK